MRMTEFMIVIIAALIFLVPTMKKSQYQEIQRQEEEATQEVVEEGELNTFTVRFEVRNPDEEPIADILWIKKAASVAKDAGIPYFNVTRQTVTRKFVRQHNQKLSVIEGTIQLDNDPMSAEYDAEEIEALVLSDVTDL